MLRCVNSDCGHGRKLHEPECRGRVWPKGNEPGGVTPCQCKAFTLAPLRKVLGLISVPIGDRPGAATIGHELYECGHHRPPKQDIYGNTNAFRRRCNDCGKGRGPNPAYLERARNWPKGK